MKGIAVIGSAGFIGSHVYEALENDPRYFPIGADTIINEYVDYRVDISNAYALNTFFRTNDVAGVINLAGVLGTHELFDDVERAIKVNIQGQYNVANEATEKRVPMVTIEQPHVWTNPYETTRGAGVRLARALAAHKGLRLATVEAFNAFGERQAYGPGHPQKIVPTFVASALAGKPMPVYGNGEQWVNLVHASDIAAVMIDALSAARDGFHPPHFYGAAVGGNFTVNEVADLIEAAVRTAPKEDISVYDYRARIDHLPMRPGETPGVGAAFNEEKSLDNELYGVYVPRFRYERLKETVEWYRKTLAQ